MNTKNVVAIVATKPECLVAKDQSCIGNHIGHNLEP